MQKNSRALRLLLAVATIYVCAGHPLSIARAQNLFEQAVEEASAEPSAEDNERRADSLYFSGKFVVDDTDPLKSVPSVEDRNANPVDFGYFLTSLFQKGNAAAERGDHAAAVRYFLALAKGAPQGAMAFRHLCTEYRALGKLSEAQQACGVLLSRSGVTVEDSAQYVQLVVTQPNELSAAQVGDVESVIEHIATQANDKALVQDLKCRLGARILDAVRLQACTSELRRLNYPAEKMSTYVWALAMLQGNTTEAKRQVELAQKTGMDASAIASMASATGGNAAALSPQQLAALSLFAAVIGFGAVAYLRLRNRKVRS
jgi:hypothetical protein